MNAIRRLWGHVSWQAGAAVLLSMAAGFGFSSSPWLGWLRWLGAIGEFVTVRLAGLLPKAPFPILFLVGFGVNVVVLALILVGVSRLAAQRPEAAR